MNWYFYKIWLPLHLLIIVTFGGILFDYVHINWWLAIPAWVLVGPIGIGVGFHRLFSHRQFKTWRPVEIILAILF